MTQRPRATFFGYAFKTKVFRIWLPNEHKVIETINVSFKESNPTLTSCSRTALGQLENVKSNSQAEASSEEGREDISPTYTPSYTPPALSDEDSELESENGEDLGLN